MTDNRTISLTAEEHALIRQPVNDTVLFLTGLVQGVRIPASEDVQRLLEQMQHALQTLDARS